MPAAILPPSRALFVHGAGGGGWEWAIWARVFATRGWNAVAPDLMPTAAGLAATTWDDYLAQVRAWSAVAPGAALVGASLGGLLALAVAAADPPRCLVLVNPLPTAGVRLRPALAPRPAVVPWGRQRSIAGTQRALPDGDAAASLYAFRRWRDESGAVLNTAAAGIAVDGIDCPLLVLASEDDADVPAASSAAVAAHYGGRCERLAGASHVGPLLGRDAAAAAARALRWIEALPQPALV